MGTLLITVVGLLGTKYLQHKRKMAEIQAVAPSTADVAAELSPEVVNRIEALEKKCEQLSTQVESMQQSLLDEQRALDLKLNAVLGEHDRNPDQEENVRIKA